MIANHICNRANLQALNCKSLANGFLSSFADMQGESDKQLIEGLVAFTGLKASEVARKANLTPSTLTRPMNQSVSFQLSKATIDKLKLAFPKFPGFGLEPDQLDQESKQEYVAIEVLPSYAGMGGGGSGEGDPQTGLVPRAYVENELRARPSDLLLLEARGESMAPDFLHGDQILIDKRDCNPIQPGSFALWDGDGYVIKLVERVPHKQGWYRIFSANGRYSAYEVDAEQVKIMGRPVWFARRL